VSMLSVLKFIAAHPLNDGRRLAALMRFAEWQVASRLIRGDIVFDWIKGSRFIVRNGETGLTQNIYTGLQEFSDMGFLLHVLRNNDLFVDVGANVGSYTILACAVIGARGYAFEPVPPTYRRLVENIRINHVENNVTAMNCGIGREQGTMDFTSDMDTVNHVLAAGERRSNTIRVDVSTLDAVLQHESPALMKIDVEGFETQVLQGAVETLKKQTLHSVIMELNGSGKRYNYDDGTLLEMMFDYGFKTYSYNPLNRSLVSLGRRHQASGNTLFIRNEAAVLDKLNGAPPVTVRGKTF
jgi:FkbM family methyltransferase